MGPMRQNLQYAKNVPNTWRQRKEILKEKKWQKTKKFLESSHEYNELGSATSNVKNADDENDTIARATTFLKTAPTLSIALPGSILDNAQTDLLRSYLASQIARAACIYNISEIIIFNDINMKSKNNQEDAALSWKRCNTLATLLEFLECPQYLRKNLFPVCEDLKYAGVLNPLDAPHHLRVTDDCLYREGVTIEKYNKAGSKSFADIGLEQPVRIDQLLPPNKRVTLKLHRSKKKNKLRGTIVSKSDPTRNEGLYWGYSVRLAKRLSDVFAETPYEAEYDLTLGTSDKGEPWDKLNIPKSSGYKHGLIVFGGVKGLEFALSNDEKLSSVENVSHLFDVYVNTCPNQGARTIRTEEAILISLAVLTPTLGYA